MNIDIVNTLVSKDLGIPEKQVALINKFYWRSVYDHLYSYDPRPLNIDYVGVLFPYPSWIKATLLANIRRIRAIERSLKFKYGSPRRRFYIDEYKKIIRHVWRLRKANKYTN